MSITVDQLRALTVKTYPTRDWKDQCQRFVWNGVWFSGTPESKIITYPSAAAARSASTIVPRRSGESLINYIKRAPLGSIQNWDLGSSVPADHNGITVGPNLVAYATANGDTVQQWAPHLKVSHTTTYPLGTYVGWSLQNGLNPAIALTGAIPAGEGGTPIQGDSDDMAHMELIQTPDGTVWFCVDRVLRYAIPAQANLDTYKAFLSDLKKPNSLVQKSATDINAYGSPVYADPLNRYAESRDIAAAQAAILKAIEGGVVTPAPGGPDLTLPLTKVAEALSELIAALK